MDLLEKKLLMEWKLKINRSKPLYKMQALLFSLIAMLTSSAVSENVVVCPLNGILFIWIRFVLHILRLGHFGRQKEHWKLKKRSTYMCIQKSRMI